MLIEKLLLQLLIILAPILIFGFFQEQRKLSESSVFYGSLLSISTILCLIFPYYSYGLYWDLRYIPLVIAFLYGNRIIGLINVICFFGIRTYLGGDALLFGYISCAIASVVPFYLSKHFLHLSREKRIRRALMVCFWPMMIMLFILVAFLSYTSELQSINLKQILDVISFGLVYTIGSISVIMLNESIIERRKMKEELIRVAQINSQGEVAASIAHEIRNPLTVVKGFLQLMQQKGDKNLTYLPAVFDELNRAEEIITGYLNFAKPQLKKIEQFELHLLIHDIKTLLNPLAIKNSVNLDCHIDEKVSISTDRTQLQQVLINLVKNAIEATQEGGDVVVHLLRTAKRANIIIVDTGKGMNEEQLKRFGTPYYSTKEKGTGLGTSISLRIVEKMGGTVSIKSKENVGTEIAVSLLLE